MSKQEDKERMRNMLMYKMYLTDKEMQDAGPVVAIIGVIVIILLVIAHFVK
jgi:hypothetical protein